MRHFLRFTPLVAAFCTSTVQGETIQKPPPSISAQEADRLITALRVGTVSSAQLASLPKLEGGAIERLTAITGIHCIYANDDEDYLALNTLVGKKLYTFRFTVTPKARPMAVPQDLQALLEGKTVTQFSVTSVSLDNPGMSKSVDHRSRDHGGICDH